MERTLISSKSVIGKFYDDFNIVDGTKLHTLVNWIGTCVLGELRINPGFTKIVFPVNFKNYRVKLPCEAESILSITYNNCVVEIQTPTAFTNKCMLFDNGITAYFSGNYLIMSVECGEISFHAYVLPVDDEGFPCIPKSEILKEAIVWYLLYKHLASGKTHPTTNWQEAYVHFKQMRTAAKNDVDYVSIQQMDRFAKMWSNLILPVEGYGNGFTYNPNISPVSDSVTNDTFLGVKMSK